jgi:iron complex outermembrane receptor protein
MWRSCESQIDETLRQQLRQPSASALGRTFRLTGLAALSLSAGTVLAQTAQPAQNEAQNAPVAAGGLEEITVTARYRTENLQQTPIAITAITAEDIDARGFTNSSDIGTPLRT